MSDKLFVKPIGGLKVKRPQSEGGLFLPDDVYTIVPNNEFWRRRIEAGDVEKVDKQEAKSVKQDVLAEPVPEVHSAEAVARPQFNRKPSKE